MLNLYLWKNELCIARPTFIDFSLEEIQYNLLAVSLGQCIWSINILNDLSSPTCVPNKTEDVNLNIFKKIEKFISCNCKCKIDDRKCNLNQNGIKINVDVNVKI